VGISWIIIGGESGKDARPCKTEWVRQIVEQCRATRTACFVKQMGSAWWGKEYYHDTYDRKGEDMAYWPADIQVREFPA
jgi:protein gp37